MIERPAVYQAAKMETPAPSREPERRLAFKDVVEASKGGPVPDDAGTGGADTDAVVEVTLRQGEGDGQTFLLPWRLVANDALSQAMASTQAQLVATMIQPASEPRAAMGAVSAPVLRPYGTAMATAGVMRPATAMVPSMSAHPIASAAAAVDAPTPAALLAGAEPWQARLLRWLERPGNGVTARVRDYRLDAVGEAQLLDALVAFARDSGVQLERVVVNAREVWRATE